MAVYAGPDIVENGLVLSLDAANLNSYSGSGVTWGDLSGLGNTGILTNGPTYNSANGGSIVLDQVDDFVQVPSPFGDIGWATTAWSLNWWFKNTFPSSGGFFQLNTTNINNHAVQSYWQPNIPMTFYFMSNAVGATNATVFTTSTTSMVANETMNFVLCYNGAGLSSVSNFTMYKNGVSLSVSRSNGASASITNTGGIQIGGVSYRFRGNVYSWSMYNRVLTQEDVTQNFNALRGRFNL